MELDSVHWKFENSYAELPDVFFTKIQPTPVQAPQVVLLNHELADDLGLNVEIESSTLAAILSGNVILPGALPLAQAYAGHQFGHFARLGDGRANLLGEIVTPRGARYDLQLKGSGPTPYSRRGDGRATLGSMLREYIISEAMHALGVPTTRSLAVVTTGEPVFRERPLPGAILTRVASSHLRVGTFEYAANLGDLAMLQQLADYTIDRHFPELASEAEPYLALLNAVIERQAQLIAQWMNIGFVHGVMNTDNVALTGETIDYGPCAFLNQYSPNKVFSSIDQNGRYAFGQQPAIAQWNLTRFAETLLPLLSATPESAIEKASDSLNGFGSAFNSHWLKGMQKKLGLLTSEPEDLTLVQTLFSWMNKVGADFTNTFHDLSQAQLPKTAIYQDADFTEWFNRWQMHQPSRPEMQSCNPVRIPRNHRVEEALSAAVDHDDYIPLKRLLTALKNPFDDAPEFAEYTLPPLASDSGYKTFCGT